MNGLRLVPRPVAPDVREAELVDDINFAIGRHARDSAGEGDHQFCIDVLGLVDSGIADLQNATAGHNVEVPLVDRLQGLSKPRGNRRKCVPELRVCASSDRNNIPVPIAHGGDKR